jgi:hypothetical protein
MVSHSSHTIPFNPFSDFNVLLDPKDRDKECNDEEDNLLLLIILVAIVPMVLCLACLIIILAFAVSYLRGEFRQREFEEDQFELTERTNDNEHS